MRLLLVCEHCQDFSLIPPVNVLLMILPSWNILLRNGPCCGYEPQHMFPLLARKREKADIRTQEATMEGFV
jgi:hypothetical protein